MSAQGDGTTYHRIQIMRIGDFKVLVDTEVDAIDDLNQPVEIKQGNPKYFGTKLMFQMISSGSRFVLYQPFFLATFRILTGFGNAGN